MVTTPIHTTSTRTLNTHTHAQTHRHTDKQHLPTSHAKHTRTNALTRRHTQTRAHTHTYIRFTRATLHWRDNAKATVLNELLGAMQTAGSNINSITQATRYRRVKRANVAAMVSAEVFNAFLEYLEAHEDELAELQCESVRANLCTGLPKKGSPGVSERARFHRVLTRQGHLFTAVQRAQVEEWETLLCQCADAGRLASQPALQCQFDKFLLFLENTQRSLQIRESLL